MSAEKAKGRRRVLRGKVVSDKMDKTVIVEVTRTVKHEKYGKYINRRRRYAAHDEENAYHVDDVVLIEESRPISRTKRWRVIDRRPTA
jgi:small subunit ribosomal protein S17